MDGQFLCKQVQTFKTHLECHRESQLAISEIARKSLLDLAELCFELSQGHQVLILDPSRLCVLIGGKWISFRRKILVFRLLEALNRPGNVVSKRDIAGVLWPHETYRPLLHDPRIFDLVQRTRSILRELSRCDVLLLTSHDGYSLLNR